MVTCDRTWDGHLPDDDSFLLALFYVRTDGVFVIVFLSPCAPGNNAIAEARMHIQSEGYTRLNLGLRARRLLHSGTLARTRASGQGYTIILLQRDDTKHISC